MPSNNLESSHTPQFVTTAKPQFLGIAFHFTIGNGTFTSTPALIIYTAAGSDGNTHIYGLKVGDTSTVPAPTQMSSLSLSPTQQICGFSQAQTDLADPTTVFSILDISPGQCGTGGDIFELVYYQDSPTTAPMIAAINTTLIYTLYQDGKLDGLILYDSNALSLNRYADDNSSYRPLGPTTIVQVTGITDVSRGQPYVIPAGYVPGLVALGNNALLGNLIPFPGTPSTATPELGLAGDLSKNFVLAINLTNTNVTFF